MIHVETTGNRSIRLVLREFTASLTALKVCFSVSQLTCETLTLRTSHGRLKQINLLTGSKTVV